MLPRKAMLCVLAVITPTAASYSTESSANKPTLLTPWKPPAAENVKMHDGEVASFRLHGKVGVKSTIAIRDNKALNAERVGARYDDDMAFDEIGMSSPACLRKLKHLKDCTAHHLDKEEKEVFSAAKRLISTNRAEKLAEEFNKRKPAEKRKEEASQNQG